MRHGSSAPNGVLEYGYYASTAYAFFGEAWGVTIPLLGFGTLVALAACCVFTIRRSSVREIFRLLKFPLGCAASFLLLQLMIHGASSMLRSFVTWVLSLIIVQSLALRPRFLHRFAIAAFMIGLCTLPYLEYQSLTEDIARVGGGEASGLANGNALAAWFGFCCLYFFVLGLHGGTAMRLMSWLAAAGCLFIVGLTVSRGPLLAIAIGGALALRRSLKRGFVPVLLLFLLSWVISVLGVFNDLIGYYEVRGAEESGRGFLWPLALERILDSWPVGVGAANAVMPLPPSGYITGPHNGFLYIALASGMIPLAFFVAYWISAARSAVRASDDRLPDAAYYIPLFLYAFLTMMLVDTAFMSPWHIAVLCSAALAGTSLRMQRIPAATIHHTLRRARNGPEVATYHRYGRPLSSR